MAILSCHVSIKLPPKISDGQEFSAKTNGRRVTSISLTGELFYPLRDLPWPTNRWARWTATIC